MILAGKTVVARKASRIGLVDGKVASAFMGEQVAVFVRTVATGKGARGVRRKRLSKRGRMGRIMALPLVRAYVFAKAEKSIMERTHGHYPAPLERCG